MVIFSEFVLASYFVGSFLVSLEQHTQLQASWQESPQKLILSVGCSVKNRHISLTLCMSQRSYSVISCNSQSYFQSSNACSHDSSINNFVSPLKFVDPTNGTSEVVNCEGSSDLQDLLVILPSIEALLAHACLNHAAQGNTSSSRGTHSNYFCCLEKGPHQR